jgi:hypothetical protein
MGTVDELTIQLDKLRKARASGILTVAYVGNGISRSVTHKSDREMQTAIQDLERRIAALQGGGNRTIRVSSSKGLVNDRDRD